MPRVALMIKGLRMAKGPTTRKLPVSLEDLRPLSGAANRSQIDRQIVRGAILMGWFFMLRMGGVSRGERPKPATGAPSHIGL